MKFNLFFLAYIIFFISCEIDNYDPPNITIYGSVIDEVTKDYVYTQQPNGGIITMWDMEYENPVPFNFSLMQNGSFYFSKLFESSYRMTILDGPFETVDTLNLDIRTSFTEPLYFQVKPFVRIRDVEIKKESDKIIASYRIEPGSNNRDLIECYTIAGETENLHRTSFNIRNSALHNLSKYTYDELKMIVFHDTIYDINSNYKYFSRVVALADNSLKRYNYSRIYDFDLK